MIKDYDQIFEINYNPNRPYISDYPYRILIIGGLELDNTNVLLNLIKHQQSDIDEIYVYFKVLFESKYAY